MEARSSNTGTFRRAQFTGSESTSEVSRGTLRSYSAEIDDSLESVGCCLPGESSSAVAFALFVACTGPHFVNEVDRGGRASESLFERFATPQIEVHPPGGRTLTPSAVDVSRSATDVHFFRRKKPLH